MTEQDRDQLRVLLLKYHTGVVLQEMADALLKIADGAPTNNLGNATYGEYLQLRQVIKDYTWGEK